MTAKELEELKALAGVTETTFDSKKWSDDQLGIVKKPNVEIPKFGVEGLLQRLSQGNEKDQNLENLSNHLNSLLGSDNFKVERLK